MAEGEKKKDWTLEVIAVIALCLFLWWKYRKKGPVLSQPQPEAEQKEVNPNPLLDPYRDAPMICNEIIEKPLAPFDIQQGGYLNIPKGTCFRGDGSKYADAPNGYGSAYAEQQAEEYSAAKQQEAILNINKKTVTFRLINSTAVKAPVQVLDTPQSTEIFNPTPPPDPPVPVIYNDFYLPELDLLNQMYLNLKAFGLGGFTLGYYWTSSESIASGLNAQFQSFNDGTQGETQKTQLCCVRACRKFISSSIFPLRSVGQAGGLIFYSIDNGDGTFTYHEAAPSDQSVSQRWSNVNVFLMTTEMAIGTGQANTTAIINQVGHIDSAALLCKEIVIVK